MTSKWNPIVVLPEISRPMHALLEEFKNEVIRFNKASAEISAEITISDHVLHYRYGGCPCPSRSVPIREIIILTLRVGVND